MLVAEKMKYNSDDIVSALGAGLEAQSQPVSSIGGFGGISTDSRTVKAGDLFFAIKGEKFDGHDFVDRAIECGATGVVLSNDYESDKVAVFIVRDTLEALGDLAAFVRSEYDLKCAAVTGSNGKTTTKEILANCLQSRYSTFRSEGNFNNLVGLPLSLFQLEASHEVAVFELGMNRLGEISRLSEICKPQVGVFTNIAPVHLEFLGTIEAVARAKFELVERLPEDGVAVLNADDPVLAGWVKVIKQEIITFGLKNEADIKVDCVEILPEGKSRFTIGDSDFEINLPGEHNIYNAACAIATASVFGIKSAELTGILKEVKPYKLRSEFIHHKDVVIINDCYNANPTSMKKAIDILAGYPATGRKVAVLADMLELGDSKVEYHLEIGEYLTSKRIDSLFATGDLAAHFLEKFKGKYKKFFKDKDCLSAELKDYLKPGDVMLIKGSRGLTLERVLEALLEDN